MNLMLISKECCAHKPERRAPYWDWNRDTDCDRRTTLVHMARALRAAHTARKTETNAMTNPDYLCFQIHHIDASITRNTELNRSVNIQCRLCPAHT